MQRNENWSDEPSTHGLAERERISVKRFASANLLANSVPPNGAPAGLLTACKKLYKQYGAESQSRGRRYSER